MAQPNTAGFAGRTALVTGGTSGIGRATALELAARGVNVVITGRRAPEGEQVLAELRAAGKPLGAKAAFVRGDVTNEEHVHAAVEATVALGGRIDWAFNNAGLELGGVPTVDATVEQYRRVLDVNVLGVLLSMKHQLRAMIAQGQGGAIVNNASVAGTIGMPGVGIYIASKHAVLGLTKSAALEVAKQGIRVNSVSPGGVETEMLDRFTGNRQKDAVAFLTSLHPIGRLGVPAEIASATLFLLSDAASFITGHNLIVDGGVTVP